jgi:SEC-C motif domain protein
MNDRLENCPCGSKIRYKSCCEPYVSQIVSPPNALALMKSRYSAYVVGNANYIVVTTCEKNRVLHKLEDIEIWSKQCQFLSLKIVDVLPEVVEFEAMYKTEGSYFVHHERSSFKQESGIWCYEDALFVKNYKIEPKRNEFCLCGSGKKYKRCCG